MKHNKTLIEKRFGKTLHQYHSIAVVQRRIASRLAELIPNINPKNGVEIGAGSGFLTTELTNKFPDTKWIANDITEQSGKFLPQEVEFQCADGELMNIPENDIVCSASTVQWFDNLPEFINKCYCSIRLNGVIAISTFGKDNFKQIDTSLLYYDTNQLKDIFEQAGFVNIKIEEWIEYMEFQTPIEVLRHIKATGVNAVSQTRWTHKELQNFIDRYPSPPILTFHPIIIIAEK